MAAGLRLLLAGLCWSQFRVEDAASPPPPPAPVRCALLEGVGRGGGLPGGGNARPALLRFGGDAETPPEPGPEPEVTFNVSDPWGTLTPLGVPPRTPPSCELNPTNPQTGSDPWSRPLHPDARSPPTAGGQWWVAAVGTPQYGVTALLQGGMGTEGTITAAVALAVLTHTPTLRARVGSPIHLHCAFAAPPSPFVLEWRHQNRGAGRVLLAYDSSTARAPRATPGAELLLGTRDGDGVTAVTLRLARPSPGDEGTYICSVFLPHGHTQTVLQLHVFEPPKVTLSPKNLVVAPGTSAELRCHVSGFYPLDVTVTWQRRAGGSGTSRSPRDTVMDSWTSGHRQAADGTYSRTAAARLIPACPQHHGDVYSCVVTHTALAKPMRVSVRLLLAGTEGPHLEDITGLFLVAFVLCGLIRWLYPKAARPKEETKKSQ
uniref:TAP binding protein n=1 Tax=Gallus gallus TaxID=9031 RepID=B5BSB3_CHICK|nr:TAP binding protein [Gallus gallus]WBF70162.1 TAP binding protein [Gallus gallus]BAG69307.1 TAP binding protein [Gallus gallus]BAG69335.1 TAP binding protein [Gallus gallus]BAG69363.1 TAP binding protein [Gallus gallus]